MKKRLFLLAVLGASALAQDVANSALTQQADHPVSERVNNSAKPGKAPRGRAFLRLRLDSRFAPLI